MPTASLSRAPRVLVPGALVAYSAGLIILELVTSQEHVRHYFTDIQGPVPFFAVNTTLSAFLLAATALLFFVALATVDSGPGSRVRGAFYSSQIPVFAFLAADDRFGVHEAVAWRANVADHFVLLAVAAVEAALVLGLGRQEAVGKARGRFLAVAVVLFAVMLAIDAFGAHDGLLRLTIEDLAKTWSAFFFFLWSWTICRERIEGLKRTQAVTS